MIAWLTQTFDLPVWALLAIGAAAYFAGVWIASLIWPLPGKKKGKSK